MITPQHTRELWGCLDGMSVVNINKQKVTNWLKTFPGVLNDLGDVPVIRRDKRQLKERARRGGRDFLLLFFLGGNKSTNNHIQK